jgi:hypothetical protein
MFVLIFQRLHPYKPHVCYTLRDTQEERRMANWIPGMDAAKIPPAA